MYTTNYTEERSGISIPDGYSGTMLSDSGETDTHIEENVDEEVQTSAHESHEAEPAGIFSGLFKDNHFGLFRGDFLKNFKIGTEELLIIAAAAFLFFTKGGDKECAIMLIILLFIR